jgi:hypothetical protein
LIRSRLNLLLEFMGMVAWWVSMKFTSTGENLMPGFVGMGLEHTFMGLELKFGATGVHLMLRWALIYIQIDEIDLVS